MKTLITGPDGLLGSNIVRVYLDAGHDVRVFVLPNSTSTTLDDLPVERFEGNLLSRESVEEAVAGCDYVVHAGANTSVWPPRSKIIRDVNIVGTENIVEACLKHQIKRLIYVSSAASYEFGTKEQPGDEKGAFKGYLYGLDYIDSKYEAHVLVEKACQERNLPAVIICPTFMFGPYDSKPSAGAMILAIYNRKLPGYTVGGKNFVDARDVAQATYNALEKGRIGESYIAGHVNLNYEELFGIIGKTLDVKPPSLAMPAGLMLFYGRLNTFLANIFGFKPGVTLPVAKISNDGQYFTPAKAVKELDMPQTPIEVAIKDAFEWMQANGVKA